MYNAGKEDGVIIEAFSVPSDLANKGITGQAVAAQILDRLSYMQSATRSSRPAASYSNNWHNDIKVQIPNTGVSISDAYRLLASWLGHQTVVSGEVYRTDTGLAVTARATGVGGATVTGTDKQLANLLSQAAETIYEETQPFRYATYRINTRGGRDSLARSLFESLAASDSVEERFWAYGGLRAMDQFKDWRLPRADALAQIAIKPDSRLDMQICCFLKPSSVMTRPWCQRRKKLLDWLQQTQPQRAAPSCGIIHPPIELAWRWCWPTIRLLLRLGLTHNTAPVPMCAPLRAPAFPCFTRSCTTPRGVTLPLTGCRALLQTKRREPLRQS